MTLEVRATLRIRNEAMLAAREKFCLTQKALAELADVPIAKISQLENLDYTGRDCRQVVDRVAGILEVDAEKIMPPGVVGEKFDSTVTRIVDMDIARLQHAKNIDVPAITLDETEMADSLKQATERVLKTLSYREREIIKLRFGMGYGHAYTLEEVGHIFQLSRGRVSQIEATALRKLQQPGRAAEFVPFLLEDEWK